MLELRIDSGTDASWLDGIGVVTGLEELRLWGVSMGKSPSWGVFARLRVLEIVGAKFEDDALKGMIQTCPSLTDLALLGCDGVDSVSIELQYLERCRIDFLGPGNAALFLSSPRLEVLEIQGFSWIRVHPNHRLTNLCIAKNSGRVNKIDFGKLANLDCLAIKGVQWSWGAVCSILQCAREVKHLFMKIEFSGEFDTLLPFPEVDFAEFFNNHPKLRHFEIHGAMFAALCQKNSLKNLDSRFVIPCLEEVAITVRSPLNAEQKLSTLEALVKYGVMLRKLIIRISQMKNCNEAADDFFDEICKFQKINSKRVRIE